MNRLSPIALQITLCLTQGCWWHVFKERSAHHIPSSGAKLRQGGGAGGSDSGMSQTRKR